MWISLVAGAVLLAEPSSAEGQSKSELLRSLHFQKGSVTIAESLAAIARTGKFVFLDSANAKAFLTKIWENPPTVASQTLRLLPTDAMSRVVKAFLFSSVAINTAKAR